jgi:polyisoprenoid-binding protein YceI
MDFWNNKKEHIMKHKLIVVLLLFVTTTITAQSKYFTKSGQTAFKASVEAFEPVEAKNNSTTAILNTETGAIAALLFVKAFHFEIALMEEHFNENYMDSDKLPKATFKGNIENFNVDKLSSTAKEFTINGTLNIRGIDKEVEIKTMLSKNDKGAIILNGSFSVNPQDFDIKIPKIVRKKIAETINIELNYELIQKK